MSNESKNVSKLMRDLKGVPGVIAGLGISIAEAQKAFNQDYLDGMERIIGLTKVVLGDVPSLETKDSESLWIKTRKQEITTALGGLTNLEKEAMESIDLETKYPDEDKRKTIKKEIGNAVKGALSSDKIDFTKSRSVLIKEANTNASKELKTMDEEHKVAIANVINKAISKALEDADIATKKLMVPVFETFQDTLKNFIRATAPSRYQFTETTLTVAMDLAQSTDIAGAGGISLGYGGIAVNASVAAAYGSDYRSAAEIKTVIHAIPADSTALTTLLDQADQLSSNAAKLPAQKSIDSNLMDTVRNLASKITGEEIKEIEDTKKEEAN